MANLTILSSVLLLAPNVSAASDCNGVTTYFNWRCGGSGDAIMDVVWAIFDIVAGIVVAGCLASIVYGAVRYSAAGSNAEAAKEGIDFIRNAIIALVLYGCFWAIIALLTGRLDASHGNL